jgi:hypothetical protein
MMLLIAMRPMRQISAVTAMVLLAGLPGCGSGSLTTTAPEEASRAFLSKAGNNRIPLFGREADAGEREAASRVLEQNLRARASHDWAGQCATLTVNLKKGFGERAAYYKVGKSCAAGLGYEAKAAPQSVLANPMSGPVVALRVKGDKGYALFRGTLGEAHAMPLKMEHGAWRVAEVKTIELRRSR